MFPSIFFVETYANKIHQKIGAPLQQSANTLGIVIFPQEIEWIEKTEILCKTGTVHNLDLSIVILNTYQDSQDPILKESAEKMEDRYMIWCFSTAEISIL